MRLFEGTAWDTGPPKCERCGRLEAECTCPPPPPARKEPGRQTAKIQLERRKAGREVTVVRGLAATDNDLAALLVQLKNACGAGGTIKEDTLEVQGNHVERIKAALSTMGYRVKS